MPRHRPAFGWPAFHRADASGTMSQDKASGHVAIAGKDDTFSTVFATGDAGLYRAAKGIPGQTGSVEAGWVVLADGSQRGAINSFINPIGTLAAPKLATTAGSIHLGTFGTLAKQQITPGFTNPIQ